MLIFRCYSDTKEDELDSTFTQLEINDTVEPNKEEQEEPEKENKVEVDLEEEEEEDEEEHFTTFYCSKRQTSCSIGFSGECAANASLDILYYYTCILIGNNLHLK